jgi:hypothetical protein
MSEIMKRRRSPILLIAVLCGYLSGGAAALAVLLLGATPWLLLYSVTIVVVASQGLMPPRSDA